MANLETLITAISAAGGAIAWAFNYMDSRRAKNNLRESFDKTIKGLFSSSIDEKISSAILLRRFLNKKSKEGKHKDTFKTETINVISSLLKKEPCGEYQKTLADSLSYTIDLSKCDFQHTNLQDMYLEPNAIALSKDTEKRKWVFFKTHSKLEISIIRTDFYMADLSYATIKKVNASNSQFYKANLTKTIFTDCNLTSANFYGAYVNGTIFKNCDLTGVDFSQSYGVPIVNGEKMIVDKSKELKKQVFISCLGSLNQEQSHLYDRLVDNIDKAGCEIVKFEKDRYREIGQLSAIKTEIANCDGIIVMGFADTLIKNGVSRVLTEDEGIVSNKIITSPWIHTEIGLAWALDKPVLLIHNKGVVEGVFAPEIKDNKLVQFADIAVNYYAFSKTVTKWLQSLDSSSKGIENIDKLDIAYLDVNIEETK